MIWILQKHRLSWILNLSSTGPADQNSRSSSWPWPCHQCTKNRVDYCELQPSVSPSSLWNPINQVSDFRYLGSMVASGTSDLKRLKPLAWCAFWKLEQLWKSPHISITTKVKLFNTTCVTILLYGCESGWSPRIWKTKSTPLLPHATESCRI